MRMEIIMPGYIYTSRSNTAHKIVANFLNISLKADHVFVLRTRMNGLNCTSEYKKKKYDE